MVANRLFFRRSKTFALLGHDVQKAWTFEFLETRECRHQFVQVMTIDRAIIIEAKFFKQSAWCHHAFHVFFCALGELPGGRNILKNTLTAFTHSRVGLARPDTGEVLVQSTNVIRDRHIIVVKNNQHIGFFVTGMIESLERHTSAHGAVTNHSNTFVRKATLAETQRHPKGCTDRGTGVTDAKGIVLTFGTQRKGSWAFGRTDLRQLLASPCQDLMRIRLMTHIPDNAIVWSIEDMVQSHSEFDNAQTSAKMTARLANAVDKIFSQFTTERLQLSRAQLAQVRWGFNLIQQGRLWSVLGNLCKHLKELLPVEKVHRQRRKTKGGHSTG